MEGVRQEATVRGRPPDGVGKACGCACMRDPRRGREGERWWDGRQACALTVRAMGTSPQYTCVWRFASASDLAS